MQEKKREPALFRVAWMLLALNAISILLFGLAATVWEGRGASGYIRAAGVASIGAGLLGLLITAFPFRQRERWAWFALWYFPIFWLAHIVFRLPPSADVVHQYVLLTLTTVGLLFSARQFFTHR